MTETKTGVEGDISTTNVVRMTPEELAQNVVPLKNEKTTPRKYKRRAPKPAEPKPSIYTGMTRAMCPEGCKPDRCVITHEGVCAHPKMSGLQAKYQNMPAVVRRYQEAKKYLEHQEVEQRRA